MKSRSIKLMLLLLAVAASCRDAGERSVVPLADPRDSKEQELQRPDNESSPLAEDTLSVSQTRPQEQLEYSLVWEESVFQREIEEAICAEPLSWESFYSALDLDTIDARLDASTEFWRLVGIGDARPFKKLLGSTDSKKVLIAIAGLGYIGGEGNTRMLFSFLPTATTNTQRFLVIMYLLHNRVFPGREILEEVNKGDLGREMVRTWLPFEGAMGSGKSLGGVMRALVWAQLNQAAGRRFHHFDEGIDWANGDLKQY